MAASSRQRSPPRVTRTDFLNAFQLFSPFENVSKEEIIQRFENINHQLISTLIHWEVKVKLLEELCCLLISTDDGGDALMRISPQWDQCLVDGPKEGRSSLAKVYCIAIAFFSDYLKTAFLPVAERLLKNLFSLTQKRVSIMASCGKVALEFVYQNVQSPRLMEILPEFSAHLAPAIRAASITAATIVVEQWPKEIIRPYVKEFLAAFESRKTDADCTVRNATRLLFEAYERRSKELHPVAHIFGTGTPVRTPTVPRLLPPRAFLRLKAQAATPSPLTRSTTTNPAGPILSCAHFQSRLQRQHPLTGSLQNLAAASNSAIPPPRPRPATNPRNPRELTLRRRTMLPTARAKSQMPAPRRASDGVELEKAHHERETLSSTKSPVGTVPELTETPKKHGSKTPQTQPESMTRWEKLNFEADTLSQTKSPVDMFPELLETPKKSDNEMQQPKIESEPIDWEKFALEGDTLSMTKSPVDMFPELRETPRKSETQILLSKVDNLETRINAMEKQLETVIQQNSKLQEVVNSQVAHIAMLLDLGSA